MMLAVNSLKLVKLTSIILFSSLMLNSHVVLGETAEEQIQATAKNSGLQDNGSFATQYEGRLLTLLEVDDLSALGVRVEVLNSLLDLIKKQEEDFNQWPQLLKNAVGHYKTLLAAVDDIQAPAEALRTLKADAKRLVLEMKFDQAGKLFNEIRTESLSAEPALNLIAAEADAANAARALVQLNTEEAADYYLRASSALETLGEKHHIKWSSYASSAGAAFREAGFYTEAGSLLKTAFELRDKHVPGTPAALESLDQLAQIKRLMARYDEALPLYQRALANKESTFGERHAQVAVALNNVADVYRLSGEYEMALPLYQRALNINREKLGNQHPDFATTLNNLAGLYESTGEYKQALELYQEALKVNERIHGENHPAVATTLNNLAGLYRAMGQFETALPLYERDLRISRRALGEDHQDVATTLNNLGILYYHMKDYAKSFGYLEQALEIFRSKLGINHPNTVRVEESLLVINRKLAE